MLIDLNTELTNNVTGIIHVGAHEGQERDFYDEIQSDRVDWHEANPEIFKRLCDNIKDRKNHRAFLNAVSDENGHINFNVSNNDGSSSSILPLKDHKRIYPHINYEKSIDVECVTLDKFYENDSHLYNSLFMDVQGAEYKVLNGATKMLENNIKFIYTEVNFFELYEGCKLMEDIDSFLAQFNFTRTHLADSLHGWGDALYQKI